MRKWLVVGLFGLAAVFLLGTAPVAAQDDVDRIFQDMDQTFQDLEKQMDAIDREFTEFLTRQWKEMDMLEGMMNFDLPKPAQLPPAPVENPPPPTKDQKQVLVPPVTVEPPAPTTAAPVRAPGGEGTALKFVFYGQSVEIKYNPKIRGARLKSVDNQGIAAFWAVMSSSDPKDLVDQFQSYRDQLALNDWGYFMLTNMAGEKLYGGNANQANLFSWFVLTKSGQQTRIGFSEDRIVLFGSSNTVLYGSPYLTLGGTKFYAMSTSGGTERFGRLYTYQGDYPQTGHPLNLRFDRYPNIRPALVNRNLKFDFRGKNQGLAVQTDKNLVDFMKFYPQTDFQVYFEASPSPYGGQALLRAMEPLVKGKSEVEAVRLLLRFTQKAFQYKTDQNQFGREKVFLPEETLLYPYSDCEDRSILFSFLIRKLTRLKVIGLDYPEHIATAVRFNSEVSGDSVTHDGAKYTICDPTYINADIGMAMPQLKNSRIGVIDING